MLPKNIVIIPNSKLAKSKITKYYLPEKRMKYLIPGSVSYNTDSDHVKKVLLDIVIKVIKEIPVLLSELQPIVRFIPGFGNSSLEFTLVLNVREYVDQLTLQPEIRKRIFKRFTEENIEIHYLVQHIYLHKDKQI